MKIGEIRMDYSCKERKRIKCISLNGIKTEVILPKKMKLKEMPDRIGSKEKNG